MLQKILYQKNGPAPRGKFVVSRGATSTSFAYEEPFYKNQEGLAAHFLRGWIFSGVLTLQSGQPFTAIDSAGGTAVQPSSPNLITPVFASGSSCGNAVATSDRLDGYLRAAAFQHAPVVGSDGVTSFTG